MSNSQHISAYNFTHISSYISGTMSREDMYAFEKAMLNDPFLEDAVIGYKTANINQANADIAAITAVINKQKDKKVISFYSRNKTWLNAAATIIIIAGVGILTYTIFNTTTSTKQIAAINPQTEAGLKDTTSVAVTTPNAVSTNKPKKVLDDRRKQKIAVDNEVNDNLVSSQREAINSDLSIQTMRVDSNASVAKTFNPPAIAAKELNNAPPTALAELLQGKVAGVEINKKSAKENAKITIRGLGSLAKNQQPLYVINDKVYDSMPATINPKNIKKIDIIKAENATTIYGAKAANGVIRITTNDNLITGKITNQNGEAVANASILINNTNKGVATNANGDFSFTTKDSIVDVSVNSIGYNTTTASVYNNKLNNIIIKENQASLNEVVVIGYGAARKRDMSSNIEKPKQYATDSLMPVGGWQYYTQYINKKISIIGDTTDANHVVIRDKFGKELDDIDIEFSVDKQGSAYNVKVITEIDSTKAKTIAAIIQTGPKWTTNKKKNKIKLPLKN